MNIVEKNWNQILNKMKQEYCSSNIAYNTWVAPLTVYEVKDNTVYILVKLKASLEHIEEKYLLPFKVCIAEITGVEYEVAFDTEESEHNVRYSSSDQDFVLIRKQNYVRFYKVFHFHHAEYLSDVQNHWLV